MCIGVACALGLGKADDQGIGGGQLAYANVHHTTFHVRCNEGSQTYTAVRNSPCLLDHDPRPAPPASCNPALPRVKMARTRARHLAHATKSMPPALVSRSCR